MKRKEIDEAATRRALLRLGIKLERFAYVNLPNRKPRAIFVAIELATDELAKHGITAGEYALLELTDKAKEGDLLCVRMPRGGMKFQSIPEDGARIIGRFVRKCFPQLHSDEVEAMEWPEIISLDDLKRA